MAVTGFYHAGISVSDMDASLRYYRDALGLEVVQDRAVSNETSRRVWGVDPGQLRVAFLRIPGTDTAIELLESTGIPARAGSSNPTEHGSGHICLLVDDLDATMTQLGALGYGARGEVVTLGPGPHEGHKAVYALDPDGYTVELYERA